MSLTNERSLSLEDALVRRAWTGDLDAFNQLVLSHQDLAYSQAYALLGDRAAAEDAAQESFIRAFQGIRGFRGGSFRGWLLRIVTNASYDFLRKVKRHPTVALVPEDDYGDEVESPAWLADPAALVEATVEQAEFSDSIYRMLDELPEAYRSVLTLVDLHDLDYEEAARALGIPLGTVKSRLARARLQMQGKLRGQTEAHDAARITGTA